MKNWPFNDAPYMGRWMANSSFLVFSSTSTTGLLNDPILHSSFLILHSNKVLYRIAEGADWEEARRTGFFASADLRVEGFVHCSERGQVLETARRYYAGRVELVLLEIDEAALVAAGVRVEREWVESRQEHFAHVFGPVPRAVVRRTWTFGTNDAEGLKLPADL